MEIRAVIFDFGNVLSGPPDPEARKQMQSIINTNSSDFESAYWLFRDDYDRGRLTAIPYWQAVAGQLHRSTTVVQRAELIAADNRCWTTPNTPMIEWAKQLRSVGFKVGLLSNIGDAMETGVLDACAWLHEFDHLTFSHRLGIAKPDADIYIHAAEGLGVAPSEILFIDDREENVVGARAAGMMAIQYINHLTFETVIEELRPHTRLPPVNR